MSSISGREPVAAVVVGCLLLALPAAAAPPPVLTVQSGHSRPVLAVAVSPDGRLVASGGLDNVVRLWHAASGKELRSLTRLEIADHARGVHDLAFSPDGRTLATTLFKSVHLWNPDTGEHLEEWTEADSVEALAFSPDGRQLATATVRGSVRLHDLASGSRRDLPAPRQGILGLAFSPDGATLAGGGFDRGLHLWDVASRQLRLSVGAHGDVVESVAFDPDGRTVATCGRDRVVRLWDPESGRLLRAVEGFGDNVQALAFSPAGQLAAAGRDGAIRLIDPRTGRVLRALEAGSWVQDLAFGPGGQRLAAAGWDGTVGVWDPETGASVHELLGRATEPSALTVGPDGRRLAVGSRGGGLALWDLAAGRRLAAPGELPPDLRAVGFDPATGLLATLDREGATALWDPAEDRAVHRWAPPASRPATGRDRGGRRSGAAPGAAVLVWSPDGRLLAVPGPDGGIGLRDVETGRVVQVLRPAPGADGQARPFSSGGFSPDGRIFATGGDASLALWDVATGRRISELFDAADVEGRRSFERAIRHVAYSPAGDRIAAVQGARIGIWEPASGRRLHTLEGHINSIWSLAFSPDGAVVASGGIYGPIRLWDPYSGRELAVLHGHSSSVESLAFLPGGRHLVSASGDGRVKLWRLEAGAGADELATLVSFTDGAWAVVDAAGRFDAAAGGEIPWLHWVVGDEPIELAQLKERYYEPGLLAKHAGFNPEPLRSVETLGELALFPQVELAVPEPGGSRLGIRLTNRGGGIGRVVVKVNGKELAGDVRGPAPDPAAAELDLAVDLSQSPSLLAGEENEIEVLVYNAEGYLASRGSRVRYRAPGEAPAEPPRLWAILSGVSDFRGDELDLRYAAKDAEDMAEAVRLAGSRLFGAERVAVTLLTTARPDPASAPTRDNLRAAFEAATAARPGDLLLVYLAGHGVNHGGEEGDFYYLTRDAASGELDDPAVRASAAVSSQELTEWIRAVPAVKQVLILDTCASGRLIEKLSDKRDVPSSQVRSLEKMKDRMGLFILAGSAADAVSYETSRYGQGLLTWSLLFGMRGAALREGQFVDVNEWLGFAADRVPALARDIGGIQQPVLALPRGGAGFDVGMVTDSDRERIPLATVRALVLQTSFQDERQMRDRLRLEPAVDEALRAASAGADAELVFVDAEAFPGAYLIVGRYRSEGGEVAVEVRLFRDDETVGEFTARGRGEAIEELAAAILGQAVEVIAGHHLSAGT